MERVCFLARVQPDRLEEYRARHRARPDEGFRRIDEYSTWTYAMWARTLAWNVPGRKPD